MQGIVMDIKDGRAVVFQKNGDITEIKDKGYHMGQQINISAYTYKNSHGNGGLFPAGLCRRYFRLHDIPHTVKLCLC